MSFVLGAQTHTRPLSTRVLPQCQWESSWNWCGLRVVLDKVSYAHCRDNLWNYLSTIVSYLRHFINLKLPSKNIYCNNFNKRNTVLMKINILILLTSSQLLAKLNSVVKQYYRTCFQPLFNQLSCVKFTKCKYPVIAHHPNGEYNWWRITVNLD